MEKASQVTNQENGQLKAQVERLQVELKEYRKRLSWVSSNAGARQSAMTQNRSMTLGNGGSDFQFQFPKFGDSSNTNNFGGANVQRTAQNNSRVPQRTSSVPAAQAVSPSTNSVGRNSISHAYQGSRHNSTGNSPLNNLTNSPPNYTQNNQSNSVDSFSGLFSPSILEAARNSPQSYFGVENSGANFTQNNYSASYSSMPGLYSGSSVSNTESPGSSSDAQNHLSSIGTSPENFNSPNNKVQDLGLNTINEEGNLGGQWNCEYALNFYSVSTNLIDLVNANSHPEIDVGGFSWLAQQNGGAFDPVLFGDYRETSDNLLSQDFGNFFNDAFPLPDLGSPSHNYGDVSGQQQEKPKQLDLLAKVDAAKDSDSNAKLVDAPKLMTCNKIW